MEKIKLIALNQENLNKLEIGNEFLYIMNNHYKKGQVVCRLEDKNVMIPLSTICSIESGIATAKRLFNY